MRFLMVVASGAMAVPAMASAALQDNSDEAAEAEGVINSSNRIVCRRMPPPVGSRIGGRRICATEAQWSRYEDESQNLLNEVFNRSKVYTSN